MQVEFISNNVDVMTHDCLSSVALALGEVMEVENEPAEIQITQAHAGGVHFEQCTRDDTWLSSVDKVHESHFSYKNHQLPWMQSAACLKSVKCTVTTEIPS